MPIAGRRITVQLGEDPDSRITLSLAEQVTTTENSGPMFQRRILTLNNEGYPDTARTYAVREVYHQKRLAGDDDEDKEQSVKARVVLRTVTTENSGPSFRRRIPIYNPDWKSNGRTYHDVRIKNKFDENVWADFRRTDTSTTVEGSGINFRRRTITYDWSNEADFDASTLRPDPLPYPPRKDIGLDIIQDLVNVNFNAPLLVIQINAAMGVGADVIPEDDFPPYVPGDDLPITGQDADLGVMAGSDSPYTLTMPKGSLQIFGSKTGTAVNPITKEMRRTLDVWKTANGYILNDKLGVHQSDTIFVNLSHFKLDAQGKFVKKAEFTVDFPALPEPVSTRYGQYLMSFDTIPSVNPFSGATVLLPVDKESPTQCLARWISYIRTLGYTVNSGTMYPIYVQDFFFKGGEYATTLGTAVPDGTDPQTQINNTFEIVGGFANTSANFDYANVRRAEANYPSSPARSVTVAASIFRKGKDFPLTSQSQPTFDKDWLKNGVTGNFAGADKTKHSIKITVNFNRDADDNLISQTIDMAAS